MNIPRRATSILSSRLTRSSRRPLLSPQTTAGSYAYASNNVTDIPAAIAIGVVGAATTPFGQMIAKRISGKTLRKVGGGPDRGLGTIFSGRFCGRRQLVWACFGS